MNLFDVVFYWFLGMTAVEMRKEDAPKTIVLFILTVLHVFYGGLWN